MKPARERLAEYRRKAADWRAKYGERAGDYGHWRKHVRQLGKPRHAGNWQRLEDMSRFASMASRAYYCDNWPAWRDLGDASDVARDLRHTGWYCDPFQDNLARGRVLQLPARDGAPRYVPGTYQTDCDGVTIYPMDVYDDAAECARAADHYAERLAEAEREHHARESAQIQIEDARQTIADCRASARALIRELRAAGRSYGPEVCAALRARLADFRSESRDAYERIRKLTDNYWAAVES